MPLLLLLKGFPWKLIGIALAALAIMSMVGMGIHTIRTQAADLATMTDQRDTAVAAAKTNAEAIEKLKRQHARDMAAIVDDQTKAKERAARSDSIKKEIANAPASDDGPVAPVLRSTLSRLRNGAKPPANVAGGAGPGSPPAP
jgi:hypothetical protein